MKNQETKMYKELLKLVKENPFSSNYLCKIHGDEEYRNIDFSLYQLFKEPKTTHAAWMHYQTRCFFNLKSTDFEVNEMRIMILQFCIEMSKDKK